jgi:hypothetical protein
MPPTPAEVGVEFVTGEEFVAHPIPQADPIVIDATGSTALAANGLGLTYGDGGAGKTTLWLEAAMHFAAGEPWLDGLLTATRPLRIGWVENEGPQEEFRRKLARKLEGWRDRVPADHFHILTTPWAALDLRLPEHRAGLAAAVRQLDLDLLIIGPLNDLGMEGGGTPDEVRAFHGYLKDVQTLAGRHVSLMVLHHENTPAVSRALGPGSPTSSYTSPSRGMATPASRGRRRSGARRCTAPSTACGGSTMKGLNSKRKRRHGPSAPGTGSQSSCSNTAALHGVRFETGFPARTAT